MLNKRQKKNIRMAVAYVFTVLMVFAAVAPFVYVVLTALKTDVYKRQIMRRSHTGI